MSPYPNCLITGSSGFLGTYFQKQLAKPFSIATLSRSKKTSAICDLSQDIPYFNNPFDLVIHAAGKAHSIPKTEQETADFFKVNHQGTLNLLKGLERLDQAPKQFIFISTVAVYGREEGKNIGEDHPLNGSTPYARSKIQAEAAVIDWCVKHRVDWIILRLPLIVGVNPPGNLGKIIAAIRAGHYFKIQKNPAKKSLVLARDIANLIPRLEGKSGIFNLTDGHDPYFNEIEDAIAIGLSTTIKLELPLTAVRWLAKGGDIANQFHIPFPLTSSRLLKMTQTLTFSDQKARAELDWSPKAVLPFLRQGKFVDISIEELHAD